MDPVHARLLLSKSCQLCFKNLDFLTELGRPGVGLVNARSLLGNILFQLALLRLGLRHLTWRGHCQCEKSAWQHPLPARSSSPRSSPSDLAWALSMREVCLATSSSSSLFFASVFAI